VQRAIVERSFTGLAAVMGVSSLLVLVVDVNAHVDISSAFHIHEWDVLSVHDTDSHLVVQNRLSGDVPNLLV
jgi:hypothetical protein